MRVCPKCGFIDPPHWKHCKWSYYIDGITFENFKLLYPNLGLKLKRPKDITEDKDFVYRLTKTGLVVERKAKIDLQNPKELNIHLETFEKGSRHLIHNPHEAKRNREKWSPSQKKLLEVSI